MVVVAVDEFASLVDVSVVGVVALVLGGGAVVATVVVSVGGAAVVMFRSTLVVEDVPVGVTAGTVVDGAWLLGAFPESSVNSTLTPYTTNPSRTATSAPNAINGAGLRCHAVGAGWHP